MMNDDWRLLAVTIYAGLATLTLAAAGLLVGTLYILILGFKSAFGI